MNRDEFDRADIVAIDEAQFFPRLKQFVECCLSINKGVILAGLDTDSFQQKFGELIDCIPMACEVTKLSALCMRCNDGTLGPFTKRIVDDKTLFHEFVIPGMVEYKVFTLFMKVCPPISIQSARTTTLYSDVVS